MRQDLIISKSVTIDSCQDKVWNALANPQIIREYLLKTGVMVKMEDGNEMIFHGEYNGHKYRDHKVIFKNSSNGEISYSYWSGLPVPEDIEEEFSTVTYNLYSKANNQTELTWTHKGYPNEEEFKLSLNKIDVFLYQIKNIVEGSNVMSN
ncbi:MAG TPA: SRPBCC domain-containing protein [Ferruginibacter sp.]|jgi:hypothetical protein|nr:SRPBCC domain-containing protein [Ferruginibacter sp.]